MTNFDKIKDMSLEKMAYAILDISRTSKNFESREWCKDSDCRKMYGDCLQCIIKWLKSDIKESSEIPAGECLHGITYSG